MRSASILTKTISISVLAVALVALAVPSSKATVGQETEQQLVWESFMPEGEDFDRYRLSDRDVIRKEIIHGVAPSDEVQIELKSGQNVTWWKGITAFKNAPLRRRTTPRVNWVRLNHVDTQDDDHGPDVMYLKVRDLSNGLKLTFEKAKAFGAHTPMYEFLVPNPGSYGGQRIIFTWERDG